MQSLFSPKTPRKPTQILRAPEKKLHIFGCQLLHRDLVVIDGAVNHVRLLLLQQDHARLDRVLDAEARDDAGTFLADSVTSVFYLCQRMWVDVCGTEADEERTWKEEGQARAGDQRTRL